MSPEDGGLSRREHDDMRDLVLAGTQRIRPAGARGGQLLVAAIALVLVGGLTGALLTATFGDRNSPLVIQGRPSSGPATSVWGGWVAFAAGEQDSDIYLVRQGQPAHRILGSDADSVNQVCPAFSPDGARLAAGQSSSQDSRRRKDAALVITNLGADGKPSGTTTLQLDGVTAPPCPLWSADGRWIAFGAEKPTDEHGVGEVWVVDTRTTGIRRLAGLRATDIEWAPDATHLFIASNGVSVYSTATGKTHAVEGTLGAVALALSPDGRSMAVQHDPSGTADGPVELWLMGTDGSHPLRVADYTVFYGVGPVWSPDGKRVAFQRLCGSHVDASGHARTCLEEHEVVVLTVGDNDPGRPFGTRTVITPPHTTDGGAARVWSPDGVSWSPDSATLLYVAWSAVGTGILAVPVDSAAPPAVLEASLAVGGHGGELWNISQSWSSHPG